MKPFWLAVTLIIGLCAGCASLPESPDSAQIRTQAGTVVMLNDALTATIKLTELADGHDATGRLVAKAKFKNIASSAIKLRARSIFKDKDGMTLEIGKWLDLVILPGETVGYTAPSTNPGSVRFLITLKYREAISQTGQK